MSLYNRNEIVKIVKSNDILDLESKINKYIELGYVLHGFLTSNPRKISKGSTFENIENEYIQVLTLKEKIEI